MKQGVLKMTISLDDIIRGVALGTLSNDDLNKVLDAVKYRRNSLLRENKREMTIGSKVQFKAKGGRTVVGEVTKINRKFIIVREQSNSFNGGIFPVNWRVPGSMLEVI
jgi:hypothetical protein